MKCKRHKSYKGYFRPNTKTPCSACWGIYIGNLAKESRMLDLMIDYFLHDKGARLISLPGCEEEFMNAAYTRHGA